VSVLLEHSAAHVLTLTLNRPEQRNALSAELIKALHQALERAELDAEVRVVVLRGAGEDFCAGEDLDEALASADRTFADNEAAARGLGLLFQRVRALPKPVVTIVHGRALGAGAALAMAGDLAIAAERAEIGYPDIQRGAVAAMSAVLLRHLVGEKLALDLLLTGRTLPAPAAVAVGLLTRAVPDAELDREVATITTALVATSATAIALTKQLSAQLDTLSLIDGITLGARLDALVRGTPDFRAGIVRFLRH
jgi:methylglutaconyl-CoA hydratase